MQDKMRNIMRTLPKKITLIVITAIAGVLAQGIAFAPAAFEFILQRLPPWGNLTFGAILFCLTTLALALLVRSDPFGSRTNWILLGIQVVSVFGVFLLQDGFAARAPGALFLFTGALTTLTVLGILSNQAPASTEAASAKPIESLETAAPKEPYLEPNSRVLREQIESVSNRLNAEKHRTSQLTFLNELSQQLESELDPPVAAQLAVNMLDRALDCSLISLMVYERESKEFISLATSGKKASIVPPGYRQDSEKGLLGRVARLKKTQLVNDTSLDPDFIPINDDDTASAIIVPILHNGQIKGIIAAGSEKTYAFSSADVNIVEGVAVGLTRAWERSGYNQRLTELIQAGISLTTLLDPPTAVQEIALLARKTLDARFVFITLLDQQGNFSRTASAGDAPQLLHSLTTNPAKEPFVQAALNASKPFRVRDIRKYIHSRHIEIDHGGLRSVLVIPIRLHGLSIGTIIVFGKQDGVFFSESDESLADLLSSQAAASIESSWLYQELRTTLNATSLLYQLSLEVTQTEDLSKAAELIAAAAYKTTNASEAGIVLISKEGEIQVQVELDASGFHSRRRHPMETINQAIQLGQSIFVPEADGTRVCYPLQTRARTIGALWIDIPESRGQNFANIHALANQAAVTLERSMLLSEIKSAYEELQETYDQTLYALMSALDARDHETEGHSLRVSQLACLIGEKIGLTGEDLEALKRGSLLHDIGKIGISDTILHKPGKLTEDEWKIMRMHPDIGSRIVERIPFLRDCMPVVRYHHERWDGTGYPLGLKGQDIPLFARIFAVADVFDALTSRRSYRKSSTPDEALAYLREHSNLLFDPQIVEALARLPYADFIQAEKAAL
jgi:putative nucleotidyltransferase with HDIG domain